MAFLLLLPVMAGSCCRRSCSSCRCEGDEKSELKLNSVDGGADKIKVIKALRSVTTLGLTEAKKAVEEAPTVIAEAASKDDAKK